MRAFFRFDASREIGGGHASRCLALADAMSAEGWTCWFAIGSDTARSVPWLAQSRHALLEVERQEQAVDAIALVRPRVTIVDHYHIGCEFERAAANHSPFVMVIDDLANRRHCCDLLLDPTLGRKAHEYETFVREDCKLLLGPNYALLKDGFASVREELNRSAFHRQTPGPVAICLGNSDPHDITSLAVNAVASTGMDLSVDVILGSNSINAMKVHELVRRLGDKYRLHLDSDRVHELMGAAGLAIGSCGTLSWERCALGLPAVGIVTAENQRRIASELSKAGAILHGGDWATATERGVAKLLERILGNSDLRLRMSSIATSICDGRGTRRVADVLTQLAL